MDPNSGSSRISPKILMSALGALFFIIVLVYFVASNMADQKNNQVRPTPTPNPNATLNTQNKDLPTKSPKKKNVPEGAIAMVGREYIYQSDVEALKTTQSDINNNTDEIIIKKLVQDSIVLQAASVDKLIGLDSGFFNSPTKDLVKRNQMLEKAVAAVKSQSITSMQGKVVSLWFYNSEEPQMGYEPAKQLATQIMTDLHNKVKTGQLSIDQAADQIKNNPELEKMDRQYRTNAIYGFITKDDKKITFDPSFDALMWNLEKGMVSDLHLSTDFKEDGTEIDAVYMFGQITEKQGNQQVKSFEDWLELKKKNYEVSIY